MSGGIFGFHNGKPIEVRDAANVQGAKVEKLYCSHHLDHSPFREENTESYQSSFRAQLSAAVASLSAV